MQLPLLAILWTGCKHKDAGGYWVPPGPQSKLATVNLYLGPETLDAEMAVTPLEVATGLMYRTNVTDETAMIFNLGTPQRASFWMTNCPVSLSVAYIAPDGVIEEIHHLEKNDNTFVVATNDNVLYGLEVNDGWFSRHNIHTGMLIRTERGSLAETFSRKTN